MSCALSLSTAAGGPKSGVDFAGFDSTAKPGTDFFQYVNGAWIKANPIPPDHSAWGIDGQLHEQNLLWLREIVEDLGKNPGNLTGNSRKLRDLYLTAMDAAKLQSDGIEPLKDELARIDKAQTANDLLELIAHHHLLGIDSAFSFGISPDERQSTGYAVYLSQGGLGLPERAYYVDDNDEELKHIRDLYRAHVAKMFQLLGDAPEQAAGEADVVLAVETLLAQTSRTPVQLRDVEAQYNKKSLDDLKKLTPQINWDLYLKTLGAADLKEVIVQQPEFFQRLNVILSSVPPARWRTYLRWHLIHQAAPYLSDPFVTENFHFYGTVLSGSTELQPRWKRALHSLDALMGEALGQLYVERHFAPEARRQAQAMVSNLIDAYHDRIQSVTWMAPQTKKEALAKLSLVMRKIGYPDKWRDYSDLVITKDSYVQNALRAQAFEFNFWLRKLKEPVDRSLWEMTPPTVNAYYDPTLNEIVFPAGILQKPYFDPQADDAVNYGAIGAVIGHELTHGFDDQGRLFDAQGNMRNWWTPDDLKRFQAKSAGLVREFDACVAIDNLHVNGQLTLGENIADLGGLRIAYEAYHKSLAGHPAPIIDGLTGDQRFFIGFGQSWRDVERPEALKTRLRVDPHSPERFRVNVPLSNVQQFYDAFHIMPQDPMYRPPDQRAEIW
ncbi:MAG TPA: M13 family metallopeptidase [Tepidisphaeraceae bacterium]|nr:M13 family metallopeptidase [Tepidisphaeraceae bacterium]